ncbi:LytTR family two component transcriptional regulator [Chitinophaga skermanii]|uniref:LytTR family two component transcriptional regulator n=1 Tax=Chitinophaga skermanii TaxID=331697 RepID=A0A327QK26_9BACT|nr:response regulator transcription factor [Chitinophaga skermanii]RAJ04044.1 LytTR family two component transcriptional regulator [Chitinophaga skermanii]
MQLKCVITDDEPMARKGLAGYVSQIDFLQLVGMCDNAVSLNNMLREQTVDLIFLDIQMPYVTGVELLQQLQNPPMVIFTTAFEQYALKGFELEAVDYLLKPIPFDRFLKAANRALELFNLKHQPQADFVFVKSNDKLLKIAWQDVEMIEATENYITIYTAQAKHLVLSTLKSAMEALPKYFIQTHKSYIINTQKINSIEGNVIHLQHAQAPIARSLKESVMEKIINDKLLKK